jgi:hypothetical protein
MAQDTSQQPAQAHAPGESATMDDKNHLAGSTSPYLLQHADNPVHWYPWCDTAFQKARQQNKLVILSIGYSACHWCHVMEHESFEDSAVAALMNEHYVAIKVDREQRPDVDQIYMDAVQAMTGSGGWPLNVVLLPDGRPVWGGTYFPKQQWMSYLQRIAQIWQQSPEEFRKQADKLTEHIQQLDTIPTPEDKAGRIEPEELANYMEKWKAALDMKHGGTSGAPKFPTPSNKRFLLRYGHFTGDEKVQQNIETTLRKMAWGGLYDHIGGGFARYSTDAEWHVPHFEKMLYDNGQLVSLYSEAYQWRQKPLYKQVVYETLAFVERELSNGEGAFYSALNADSEGEEGKYYVWTEEEIEAVLTEPETKLVKLYYDTKKDGNWEHDKNVFIRRREKAEVADILDIDEQTLADRLQSARQKLFERRQQRVRPSMDDKVLTSWNAMMARGYVDAYRVWGQERFLQQARATVDFLLTRMREGDRLYRSYKDGQLQINGYLDDYAFTIDALIALYQATFEQRYLAEARELTEYVKTHFEDPQNNMFFYTSDEDPELIARKKETQDNVIPSSNAMMAHNLLTLGQLYDIEAYRVQAREMLMRMQQMLEKAPHGFAKWGQLALRFIHPDYEVAITGPAALQKRDAWDDHYVPNALLLGTTNGEEPLPLLKQKYQAGQTTIYVCQDKTCQLPTPDVEQAVAQVE